MPLPARCRVVATRPLVPSALALALAVAALALIVPAGPAAAAPAADQATKWRVSGSITGTYENVHGWVACRPTGEAALFHQRSVVNVRMRSVSTARFTPRGMFVRLKVAVGGSWTLSGSYPPFVDPNDRESACGPPMPVNCAGPVVSTSRNRVVRLFLDRLGRRVVGYFAEFVEVVESARYAKPDPSRPFCAEDDPATVAARHAPILGLGDTSLANRAVPSPDTSLVRAPVSRFLGRRKFTVVLPPAPLESCLSLLNTPSRSRATSG